MYYINCDSYMDIEQLEVIVFGVGFGDCIHITLPNNTQFLIDTGLSKTHEMVSTFLKANNKKIDFILLTHDHGDHIGGFKGIINCFNVKSIVYWKNLYPTPSIKNTQNLKYIENELLKKCNIGINSIHDFLDNYKDLKKYIQVLHPGLNTQYNSDKNRNSIVLNIMLGPYSFLFMGDATSKEEEIILNDNVKPKNISFLKVGHHGSSTSSSEPFINLCSKDSLAVCSCKENRNSKPPDINTLKIIGDKMELKCTGNTSITIKACWNQKKIKMHHEMMGWGGK